MARYDRIARLESPERDATFGCWMTLRDLEGREREPQLGRRARLRFLALRPLRRLLQRGLDGIDRKSLELQLEGIRAELGSLPSSDAERMRLDDYIQEVGGRAPAGVVRATLDVGASAEAAGHTYAAEEYYCSALELAEAHDLIASQIQARARIGRVAALRKEWDVALEHYAASADLADRHGDLVQWACARDGAATVEQRRGDAAAALRILTEIEARGRREKNEHVRAIAAAGRCALNAAAAEFESSIEAGWEALQLFPPDVEARYPVLLNLASAFRRMALREAAESAYRIIAKRATWPEHRIEAEVENAAIAAECQDLEAFRRRRERLIEGGRPEDAQTAALLDLGLGRGSMLAGEIDDAREHLRRAISTARDSALDTILVRAEDLLDSLERSAAGREPRRSEQSIPASDASRAIAGRMASLRRELVAPA